MKSVILLACVAAFSSLASAEYKQEVKFISEVALNDGILTGNYTISGGCADHQARVEVQVVEKKQPKYTDYKAVVKVVDVTDQGDDCQAMVPVSFKIDLRAELQKAAKASGFRGNYIKVELPGLYIGF